MQERQLPPGPVRVIHDHSADTIGQIGHTTNLSHLQPRCDVSHRSQASAALLPLLVGLLVITVLLLGTVAALLVYIMVSLKSRTVSNKLHTGPQ